MTIKEELKIIICDIYEEHPAGGELHIVLDDENVEDSHILWCIKNLKEGTTYCENTNDELKKKYLRCCELLLQLSEKERLEIIKGVESYANP